MRHECHARIIQTETKPQCIAAVTDLFSGVSHWSGRSRWPSCTLGKKKHTRYLADTGTYNSVQRVVF